MPQRLDEKQAVKSLAQLDSNDFAVRKKAAEELERLGFLAAPLLRKARKHKASIEYLKRVDQLLNKLSARASSPETLRRLRGGSSQYMRIEHVHIEPTAQAVIGNLQHRSKEDE